MLRVRCLAAAAFPPAAAPIPHLTHHPTKPDPRCPCWFSRCCSKNGEHLGVAFRNVGGHPLFPTIGLHRCGGDCAGGMVGHRLAADVAVPDRGSVVGCTNIQLARNSWAFRPAGQHSSRLSTEMLAAFHRPACAMGAAPASAQMMPAPCPFRCACCRPDVARTCPFRCACCRPADVRYPAPPPLLLCSQGAKVEVNFGRQPFHYDWNVLVAREEAAQQEALHRCALCCIKAGPRFSLVRAAYSVRSVQHCSGAVGAALGQRRPQTCSKRPPMGSAVESSTPCACHPHLSLPCWPSSAALPRCSPPQHKRVSGRGASDCARLSAALRLCRHPRRL